MEDAPAAAAASAAVKRRRGGDESGAGLRRVAEIVMVLAAAGEVRAGREPTAAERALAAEARERLAAAVAEGAVRPKDLFPGEAVRAVVEDLGLNRAKDHAAMGFRPPKASIADRLMLTKRKMEEVKEAQAQPTISAPQAIVSSGMSEFQGFHGASKFGVGAPRNPPAVAAFAATAPLNSASLVILRPPGSSPVKPVSNSSVVTLPHTGPPHLKLERDVNGALNLARNGATIVHSNKSTQDTSARSNVNAIQSSSQLLKNQDTKPVAIRAATGNPATGHPATPGVAFVPPKPTFANHNDIAKSVQQYLHQRKNHPSWTSPSTEYMHSRLGCQICKVAIMDADSLLVCDACERGVHLNCLQRYGNKGVPKAEWHCSACLAQSKGKPLPPKYGKVTRTVVASKAAPPCAGAQFSLQGSAENMAAKENCQKLAANGNLVKSISTKAGSTVHNTNVLALSATTAGSQSQLVSTLRPSIGNAIKAESSSNEREGSGQSCSNTIEHNMKSLPNKRLRSGFSLNSVDSANDITHGKQGTEISGVKCPDNSAGGAEAKIKSEAHSEPLPSRDEEMVDNSGTSVEQTVVTEEKLRTQATFKPDKMKDVETTTNTGTSTDQGSNFSTEEKLHSEVASEPHTINHVEMTANTGISLCQSSNVAIEEKLQTDTASEPHTINDMEMSTANAPAVDQSSSLANEEKSSERTSAINDVEFTSYTGIATDQRQHANGSTENGIQEPPNAEAYKDKPGCNAPSDHGSTQKVAPNGILCSKDEILCDNENEAVGVNEEAKEAN
ncbi:PHD finger protein At3g20280-like [Phragmites australis]|uniref:PHD finger protein At3g20280-like n=1 Tax=Phragmites australis TaxID=29695 RepID=UPI002D772198|nr:PHD finger protein At3g20280-like [Phragmites australis]